MVDHHFIVVVGNPMALNPIVALLFEVWRERETEREMGWYEDLLTFRSGRWWREEKQVGEQNVGRSTFFAPLDRRTILSSDHKFSSVQCYIVTTMRVRDKTVIAMQ